MHEKVSIGEFEISGVVVKHLWAPDEGVHVGGNGDLWACHSNIRTRLWGARLVAELANTQSIRFEMLPFSEGECSVKELQTQALIWP